MGTYKLKMLLLGDAGVGKTQIIKRFIKGSFQKAYKMTIGCDIFTKDVSLNEGHDLVTLSIWDIVGQDRFKFFRSSFYRGSAGALIIFDLTRYPTFNPNVVYWIRELWSYTGRIPMALFGSKAELVNMRSVRISDIERFAAQIPCPYYESINNMEPIFQMLATAMLQRMMTGYVARSKYETFESFKKSKVILKTILKAMGFKIDENSVHILNDYGLFSINITNGTTYFEPIKCSDCINRQTCPKKTKNTLCIVRANERSGWSNLDLLDYDLLTLSKIYAIAEDKLPDHVLNQMKRIEKCLDFNCQFERCKRTTIS